MAATGSWRDRPRSPDSVGVPTRSAVHSRADLRGSSPRLGRAVVGRAKDSAGGLCRTPGGPPPVALTGTGVDRHRER